MAKITVKRRVSVKKKISSSAKLRSKTMNRMKMSQLNSARLRSTKPKSGR